MRRLPFADGDELAAAVEAASEVVASGGVVLLPTESYYGLGADPRNRAAIERVFALKARPAEKELPVVCSDWRQVESLVRIPDAHRVRLGRIWPAAMTSATEVTTIGTTVNGLERQVISANVPGLMTGPANWLNPAWTTARPDPRWDSVGTSTPAGRPTRVR